VSQALAIFVVINNYVHDVATGLVVLSALWIGWAAHALGPTPSPETQAYFERIHRRAVRFVLGGVALIVVTGVVRAIYFMRLEYVPALGKDLVPVLVFKHVLLFTVLGAGVYAWIRLERRLAH